MGIAAFVEGKGVDARAVREDLVGLLPATMLPDEVFVVPSLPINGAGKVDRTALAASVGRTLWSSNGDRADGRPVRVAARRPAGIDAG
jgi:acyl-CoA synthetase (AMP-forming)/AMP-acid ligase II